MGQLNPSGAIFLSAGVPNPSAKHFVSEGDSAAISAAVSALLYVVLGRRQLVWGGHPAITPMVWAFATSMEVDYGAWVKLYQSAFFQDEFPEETAHFKNVVVTPKVAESLPESLLLMRQKMLDESNYAAAVFLGGMQGIFEEFELFKERSPSAAILPVMTTGGAAAKLGEQIDAEVGLASEYDYIALFHRLLEIDPNERRYASPAVQPANVADRILRPTASPPSD
jgi:hypothetical protein